MHNVVAELHDKLVPIDTLIEHPRNPRQGDVEGLRTSLRYFGQVRPIVVQRATRQIVAGNHTKKAAEAEGWTEIAALVLDMADDTALEYLIADNRWSDRATNDDAALVAILAELDEAGRLLPAIGYDTADVDDLRAQLDAANQGSPEPEGRGDTLEQFKDINVADPEAVVALGDVWALGDHRLVCESVFTGHKLWVPLLTEGAIFAPYPVPTLPLTERAQQERLVMVQPDSYLAGHVVDKYRAVFGDETAERING